MLDGKLRRVKVPDHVRRGLPAVQVGVLEFQFFLQKLLAFEVEFELLRLLCEHAEDRLHALRLHFVDQFGQRIADHLRAVSLFHVPFLRYYLLNR